MAGIVVAESRRHIHFVTGRLAEAALRRTIQSLAGEIGFAWSIQVMPITVAALMTARWIADRIDVPTAATDVMIPGYCNGDLDIVAAASGVRIERGPRDLRELPRHFGRTRQQDYGDYDIEIIAEINHSPQLPIHEIVRQAKALSVDGADVIDVGCDPGDPWQDVGAAVRVLKDEGLRVSIDSLNPKEIEPAVKAGAELVLSVNGSNRDAAKDWGAEVVVIPDDPTSLGGIDETVALLQAQSVRMRLDPVLAPIGFGFAQSLGRYQMIRERYPDLPMMMGIGNLTELTDADSAAINVLLLGFCQELNIGSVLTTQVIHWAKSCVRECDLARRLVHFAVEQSVLPKHLEPGLVPLRGEESVAPDLEELNELATSIRDHNYRIFARDDQVHIISSGIHIHDADPFALFATLLRHGENGHPPKNLDASHAFYLGYECAKAITALTLSKQYRQDEALDWGFLTRSEQQHYRPSKRDAFDSQTGDAGGDDA